MSNEPQVSDERQCENVNQDTRAESLLEVAGTLQLFAVQLLSATVAGSFENSFAGASVYAAEHARRLAKIVEGDLARDIDAAAWSARCLYETRMLLFNLLSHPKLEAEQILQRWVDQGDVQVAKTLTELYSNSESEKQRLREELQKFGRPPVQAKLAELTGCVDEHRMMYGLLCLYTHPSKFLLFGSPEVARNQELANVICDRSVYYLQEIQLAISYVLDNVS